MEGTPKRPKILCVKYADSNNMPRVIEINITYSKTSHVSGTIKWTKKKPNIISRINKTSCTTKAAKYASKPAIPANMALTISISCRISDPCRRQSNGGLQCDRLDARRINCRPDCSDTSYIQANRLDKSLRPLLVESHLRWFRRKVSRSIEGVRSLLLWRAGQGGCPLCLLPAARHGAATAVERETARHVTAHLRIAAGSGQDPSLRSATSDSSFRP